MDADSEHACLYTYMKSHTRVRKIAHVISALVVIIIQVLVDVEKVESLVQQASDDSALPPAQVQRLVCASPPSMHPFIHAHMNTPNYTLSG